MGWRPARLAFASVLGLALILTIRQYPPAVSGDSGADQSWMMAAMSNQTLAAYVTRHDSPQWNLPADRLQGTNVQPPVSRRAE